MDAVMSTSSSELELFQRFMNAYKCNADNEQYNGSIERVRESDGIIVLGMRVSSEGAQLLEVLKSACEKNSATVLYAHPLEDVAMQDIAAQFMKYEPGAEEGVIALFANHLLKDAALSSQDRKFLDDLDLGYLEAESNIGEEEFEEMGELFANAKNKVFVLGSDLLAHPRAQNIAKLCALIEQNSDFSFFVLFDAQESQESIETHKATQTPLALESIAELPEFNGTVIYNVKKEAADDNSLRGSAQFARAARISDGDVISVSFGTETIERVFKVEDELKGTIAINPTFDITVDPRRYKFERSQINKINQNSESNNE